MGMDPSIFYTHLWTSEPDPPKFSKSLENSPYGPPKFKSEFLNDQPFILIVRQIPNITLQNFQKKQTGSFNKSPTTPAPATFCPPPPSSSVSIGVGAGVAIDGERERLGCWLSVAEDQYVKIYKESLFFLLEAGKASQTKDFKN